MEDAYVFKVLKKEYCTGCEGCVNACPVKALTMRQDRNGFYYPRTDYNKCISCEKCIKVCPKIRYKQEDRIEKIEMYAGYALDKNIVLESSSGGLFRVLAEAFLKKHQNGKICAVIWDDNFKGAHYETGGLEQLPQMQRSKYVQSRKRYIYRTVKKLLDNNTAVLFVGCPCEVAAISAFLGKTYSDLYLIDLVCQGPTAPAVLETYINGLEKKYKSKVININLRLPAGSNWIPQWSEICFENKKKYLRAFYETALGVAVHYMQRESCFTCDFRGKNRLSDITLGDFHGIDYKATYYNPKGTSILCINSSKGSELLHLLHESAYLEHVDYMEVNKHNKRLTEPREKDVQDELFTDIYIKSGLNAAIKKTLSWKKKIKYNLPTILSNKINGYKGCELNEK